MRRAMAFSSHQKVKQRVHIGSFDNPRYSNWIVARNLDCLHMLAVEIVVKVVIGVQTIPSDSDCGTWDSGFLGRLLWGIGVSVLCWALDFEPHLLHSRFQDVEHSDR